MKLYLIATNHANQMIGCKDGRPDIFLEYIKSYCIEHNDINLIAEELSIEALEVWKSKGITASVCKELSEKLKISHIFCDPNSDERKQMGIESDSEILKKLRLKKYPYHKEQEILNLESAKNHPKREKFWLDKIVSQHFKSCLFVFGKSHHESFSLLLRERNISFKTINHDWK